MGRCKQLLPLDGTPAIVRCLEAIRTAGIGEVVVVLRENGRGIEPAIAHLPVTIARNGVPGSDMASSVRAGLLLVPPDSRGVLVCLADHPLVTAATFARLVREHARDPESILIPTHDGRKGHPTLFPRQLLAAIETLPTLRDVLATHAERITTLPVADAGVCLDMDTPDDYRRLVTLSRTASPGTS